MTDKIRTALWCTTIFSSLLTLDSVKSYVNAETTAQSNFTEKPYMQEFFDTGATPLISPTIYGFPEISERNDDYISFHKNVKSYNNEVFFNKVKSAVVGTFSVGLVVGLCIPGLYLTKKE